MSEPVLVRTLPLSNANYGGILQAYALQHVLRDLGLSPVTDVSRVDHDYSRQLVKRWLQDTVAATPFRRLSPESWREASTYRRASRKLTDFVLREIATVRLYKRKGRPDARLISRIRLFVVGSDQVWRARYGQPESYMFDFDPVSDARIVSYAASFGVDHLEGYTPSTIARCGDLLNRFDGVSVRESSGVQLCRDTWGLDAVEHVDPTLLLSASRYQQAFGNVPSGTPFLSSYILDPWSNWQKHVGDLASQLNLPHHDVQGGGAPQAARQGTLRPSVEEWFRSISNADFVVTDSFHGMVFSILTNRPFVAVINRERGASRFTSLARRLGLESRLVERSVVPSATIRELPPINWEAVNQRVADARNEGISFLRTHLVDGA